MTEILNEITPLSSKDCFYVVDRHKTEFTYPLHQHREYELNFVEHGAGCKRIVGDSVEEIGDYDLVLVGGENLGHAWEQGRCRSRDIREITIQFERDLFNDKLLSKNQFSNIRKMFERAHNGLAFSMGAIVRVYSLLDTLAGQEARFTQLLQFLLLLNTLAEDGESRELASGSFAQGVQVEESRRVKKVKDWLADHYVENPTLSELASMVGMTPTAFSRFFKLRTGRTLSDYLIDLRLGNAARLLVDTTRNVSEICYECGFNNLSNFNRIFKAKRGVTPREFRALYKKNRLIV